ncbi:hypothetical protein COCNU_11G003480 [Cocos nucifera]|uniref:Uncharacterized protein n=1 Tax=Cocos nucifera TaxID=13894 RepID=A0A8K0IND7_COCNU|nr:hypothetical protein COCNU_11G003480 [Cocos nucifera]
MDLNLIRDLHHPMEFTLPHRKGSIPRRRQGTRATSVMGILLRLPLLHLGPTTTAMMMMLPASPSCVDA